MVVFALAVIYVLTVLVTSAVLRTKRDFDCNDPYENPHSKKKEKLNGYEASEGE